MIPHFEVILISLFIVIHSREGTEQSFVKQVSNNTDPPHLWFITFGADEVNT